MAVTRSLLSLTLAVGIGSTAHAGTPSPDHSDLPRGILLVGSTGGVSDVRGEFTMIIRDATGAPCAACEIVLDFNACTPDIRVCAVQTFTGVTADCAGTVGSIRLTTDAAGQAIARVRGGANNNAAHTPGAGFGCAVVRAEGVELGRVNVGVLDQNGAGGVNPADHANYLNDFWDYWDNPAGIRGRSDLNGTNSINPVDHSIMHSAIFGGGSISSCSTYCH